MVPYHGHEMSWIYTMNTNEYATDDVSMSHTYTPSTSVSRSFPASPFPHRVSWSSLHDRPSRSDSANAGRCQRKYDHNKLPDWSYSLKVLISSWRVKDFVVSGYGNCHCCISLAIRFGDRPWGTTSALTAMCSPWQKPMLRICQQVAAKCNWLRRKKIMRKYNLAGSGGIFGT